MSKPEPRIDKDGVPWCRIECSTVTTRTCNPDSSLMCETTGRTAGRNCICLPQVQLDEAERERLAALVEKLPKYADTGEVFVPCVDKAYATLKRNPDKKHTWQVFEITAACYNLGGWCWMLHALFTPQKTPAYSTREAATAAQKENDNGCTDTTG